MPTPDIIDEKRSTLGVNPVNVLTALEHRGYFVMPLSEEMFATQEKMFDQFNEFDSRPLIEKITFSLTPDLFGENNGWHGAGGLSRYNQCREGIIFQASSPVWPMLSRDRSAPPDDFSRAHENFRSQAHILVTSIMEKLAAALDLPEPSTYFTADGPMDIIGGSQFHVKKLALSENEDLSALHKIHEEDREERYLTLRAHRDPSVVSIVFHRRRTCEEVRGLGLQFKDPTVGAFTDIPDDACLGDEGGGAVCVVIAGSILELISEGRIKAPLHRVASFEEELVAANRIAATFFFQPNLDQLLVPFSAHGSTTGTQVEEKGAPSTSITYGKWKAKAYGSYYKGK